MGNLKKFEEKRKNWNNSILFGEMNKKSAILRNMQGSQYEWTHTILSVNDS